MPSTYTEHADKWKALADLDYFTQFVKAWIPFNAWYTTYYPSLTNDRAAINEIKNNTSAVKSRFIGLLNGGSDESNQFRQYLAHLHTCLSNYAIENDNQRINFEAFVIELDRSCLIQNGANRGMRYYVELTLNNYSISSVKATVINSKRTTILNYNHTTYDLSHLRANQQFGKLSSIQKSFLEQKFNQANPRKPVRFLTADVENCIKIGQYNFINDSNLIFKGVIEIIYNLRNVLFHGQIIPNKDTNTVYEPAYKVLKMIVDAL